MRLTHGGRRDGLLKKLERVQHRLETSGAWDFHQRVEQVISSAGLDENAEFGTLSAGLKRRVLLAKALANEPDVLLLDEPTNHLDIDAILWLEDFLLRFTGTLVFVTHDRAFLQRIATRIVEIDRGRLLSFDCDYATYLERRQAHAGRRGEGLAGLRQEAGQGGGLDHDRASRPAARATKAGCGPWSNSGWSARPGGNGWATPRSPSWRPAAAGDWWPTPRRSRSPSTARRSSRTSLPRSSARTEWASWDPTARARPLCSSSCWESCSPRRAGCAWGPG